MNKATKIEKQFVSAMQADPKAPHGLYDLNNPQDLIELRKQIRSTAYHEAGHFVARIFTLLEDSHVVAISIIPCDGSIGRMLSERHYTLSYLASYPPPVRRIQGMMKLLEYLAGYGTQTILDKSKDWESIFEYCDCDDIDDERGNDFSTISRIAEIMAHPYMPAHRILKLADKWTLEMLKIPSVWNAIETVANILMTKGSINKKEISNLSDRLEVTRYINLPKWRRRFAFTPEERKKYIKHE